MNKLDELIKELCPNGVEYKELSYCAEVLRGKRLTKKELKNNGEYPVYHGGLEPLGFYDDYNREAQTTMVINVGASAGSVGFCDKKFWSSDGCYCIKSNEKLLSKFIYYVLYNSEFYFVSKVRYAGIPTLDKKIVENFMVPIPPLPIQKEIVRILDNFTELTAELTAELIARKKQYEYYLKNLILDNPNSKFINLGEIGEVSMCKRIMKSETSSFGEVPFYKIGTFGKAPDAFISKELFIKYKNMYSYPKKGDLLISASGTIGRVVIFDGEPSYFQDSNIVWINNDETKVLNKFLYYCYQLYPWRVSNGGTISRLYNNDIKKTRIFVPPLKEQQHIVSILDRFDKLCNDISEGLPAEIEARQKQYEYYRNKLLTFKPLEEEK